MIALFLKTIQQMSFPLKHHSTSVNPSVTTTHLVESIKSVTGVLNYNLTVLDDLLFTRLH